MRGRNVEWLEKAVRDAATLTGEDAVREKVVEILANDIGDLLQKLDGREVTIAGATRKLATKDLAVGTIEMDWRTQALSAIADPNVAFILLMIGVYGIMFEFWNPGAIAPGVVGGICLLLALAALTSLPLNIAGLALILFGIALMVAEAFTPSFGVMGIGGIAAFVIGALFLFDPEGSDVDVQVALPVILGAALTSFALMTFVVGFAVSAHRRKVVSGSEELIGAAGVVVEWQDTKGAIRVHGEIWAAMSDRGFAIGDTVRVSGRQGLTLTVAAA
jgi:membrane-bound serine protease (ClpP class)